MSNRRAEKVNKKTMNTFLCLAYPLLITKIPNTTEIEIKLNSTSGLVNRFDNPSAPADNRMGRLKQCIAHNIEADVPRILSCALLFLFTKQIYSFCNNVSKRKFIDFETYVKILCS